MARNSRPVPDREDGVGVAAVDGTEAWLRPSFRNRRPPPGCARVRCRWISTSAPVVVHRLEHAGDRLRVAGARRDRPRPAAAARPARPARIGPKPIGLKEPVPRSRNAGASIDRKSGVHRLARDIANSGDRRQGRAGSTSVRRTDQVDPDPDRQPIRPGRRPALSSRIPATLPPFSKHIIGPFQRQPIAPAHTSPSQRLVKRDAPPRTTAQAPPPPAASAGASPASLRNCPADWPRPARAAPAPRSGACARIHVGPGQAGMRGAPPRPLVLSTSSSKIRS